MNLVMSKYCSLEYLTIDTDSENSLVPNSDKTVIRKVKEDLRAVMLWHSEEATEHIKGSILF
jgi:protoporphyrinogen oxidase